MISASHSGVKPYFGGQFHHLGLHLIILARIGAERRRAPAGEGGALGGLWQRGIIRDVIDDAAESVEPNHVSPPLVRQAGEREGEVGLALLRDLRAGGGELGKAGRWELEA